MSAQPQYTPDQIKQAARNAYSKGDYAGAKRLDGLYQRSVQQQPQAQAQPQANDGAFAGFGDAFIRGIDQPLENMGVTAETLGYQDVADSLKGAVDERPGQSASTQFMNADQDGSFAWRYLPKAGVEQAGQFAGSILSRLGGMGLGGLAGSIIPGAGTAGGAMVGGLTGPVVFEAAQQLGPIALERAKNNGRKVPNAEDWKYATGTSAGMGALNTIAPGLSGKLKRMLVEGATEGTQSVVEQVGSTVNTKKGLEVDPRQALAEGIIGGTSAGMVDTSVGTVKAAANLVTGGSSKSDMTEEESQAAASYAQRLIKKAESNDYDLGDVDRSAKKGAREAVDQTHVDMTTELKVLFDDLKDRIAIQDRDSVAEVSEKILAHIAYRKARNKTKNRVDQENFAAVERLAGDTQEGQRALNLMRELNQMTDIHNGGYKGGVSAVTDQFLPIGLGGEAGYDQGRAMAEYVMRPMASLYTGVATGGASTLGQLGVVGTGRAIDKVTGRRSRVQRYVDQYGNQQGQPAATGTSVREANRSQILEEERLATEEAARQEQMVAENRDANLQRVQQGAPPQFGSPEDIMRDGTGLDRAEIAQVIRILKSNPNTLPGVRRAIEAYEQGIAVGGEMDFSLIRDINAFVDANPNYVQRSRQPNIQRAAATAQAGAQQNLTQRDQNYQRGIENNLAFVKQLQDQLNDDKSVRPIEKAKLLDTLNSMQFDLGADPIAALKAHADRLYDGGVSEDSMQKYFVPYMERVQQQQQAAQRKKLADRSDTETIVSAQDAMDDARIVPVPFNNQGMQNAFGVNSPTEGGNYIDLDSREDLTGNTYAVGSVKIIDGKPLLETNDAPAAPATRDSGNKVKVNLFKKKAGWSWVDYDGPDTIVSTEQGGKHHYSLNTDFQTPVTLQTYPKQPSEPRLRPTSQGKVVLGNKIGSISVRGKLHPVYDQVTIQDKRADRQQFNDDRSPQLVGETVEQRKQPALTQVSSPNIISLVDGTETPPKMTVKAEVGNFLQTRALEKLGGIQRDINDPADRSAIADDLVSEAIYEMESKDSAVEWYDSTIESMLEMLSLKYPEIAGDPNAKTPMLVSLAIMSQNLDVPTNLKMAEKAYEYFRENGRFEIHGTGKSLAVMEQNFDKANRLLDKLGSMEAFTEFLQMELPVKDMNKALQGMLGDDGKVGGENMDTVVYGSAIFGPKVGNGFYTNLRGDFTPVTMDMWFMRTVGRLKGDLMEFDEAKFQKQLNRLKTALGRKRISREKLIEEAMRLRKVHEKDYNENKKLYKAKIKKKSEATLAAETIVKSLTATTDAPKSGGERNILRDLVQEAVSKFNDKTGLNIEPAAFQALIWYPEQDLYKSLGVQLKHVRQDYANSAKQLLKKEGYNEQELNSAIDRVRSRREQRAGQVRQGPGQVDQQAAGPADGRSGSPVPQGQGPILTQDERDIDYTDVTKFLPPTVNKVKDQLPEAQAIVDGVIHIGKKGTKFENGIGTEEDLLTLADHVNIAVKIYDDAERYYQESGDKARVSAGRHRGYSHSSKVWVKGKELRGELPAFITLTHEISHSLENRAEDPSATEQLYARPHSHPGATKGKEGTFYKGSLRDKIASAVHSAAWYQGIDYEPDKKYYRDELINPDSVPLTYEDAAKIKNEIEKIQRMQVGIPSRPDLGTEKLRGTPDSITKKMLENEIKAMGQPPREIDAREIRIARKVYKKDIERVMRPYRQYIREDAEFAVDPVIFYLMDPKTMKRVAPVTSKYIRDHFNKSTLPVKFHANPMAVILSILMAGALMKGEEEEEEKMAPGALSPQPALLSA